MSPAGFEPTPRNNRLKSALDRSATTPWCMDNLWINVLQDSWTKLTKLLCDNICPTDYGYMCIWTDSQTKSTFLISM